MKKIFTILLFSGTMAVNAQTVEEKLKADVVTIKDGKYIYDVHTLITVNGQNLQMSFHAEASASGFISRDNFIACATILDSEYTKILTASDEAATTEEIDEITGKPDVVVNCYMSKIGVQTEAIGKDGPAKSLVKWSDLL